MSAHDPMAKYVEGMPDELQDILRKWSDRIAENEALTARAVAAETALAAARAALGAFGLHDDDGDTLLTYEHGDGEVCIVAEITCAPVLETLEALLDVPDQPNPTGDELAGTEDHNPWPDNWHELGMHLPVAGQPEPCPTCSGTGNTARHRYHVAPGWDDQARPPIPRCPDCGGTGQ